jgi:lysophospholipase L1-like esterase
MKKIISLFIVLILLIVSIPVINADTEETDKLLLLGDSIAYGYGIDNNSDKYGNIVAKDYDFDLINDAVVGDETADLLKLINKDTTVQEHIKSADTIVVSIGGNDFLGLRYNFAVSDLADIISKGADSTVLVNMLDGVKKNISLIHKGIRKLNENVKIVLQTVYNPFQGKSDAFTTMLCQVVELVRKDFTQIYFDEAKDDDYMSIADIESTFRNYYDNNSGGAEIVQSDYVHPSVQGHRMIAQVVEKAIDTVHRARWSTLSRSTKSLLRLSERNFEED